MINAELAGDTLADIKGDLEHWSQGNWAVETDCGTAYCFGGRAVTKSGIPIQLDKLGAYIRPEDVPDGVEGITWTFRDDRITVRSVATSVLGLTEEQAEELFEFSNEFDDLERIVNNLIAGAYEAEIEAFVGVETELEEGIGDLPDEGAQASVGEESQEEPSEALNMEEAPF